MKTNLSKYETLTNAFIHAINERDFEEADKIQSKLLEIEGINLESIQ